MKCLIFLFLLTSCITTEVLNAPEVEQADTVLMKKPHKPLPPRDTTERVPIGFNPSVGDWDETEIEY